MGRFVSRDPIAYEGGWNLYGYVSSRPTGATDPLGLAKGWFEFFFGSWPRFKGSGNALQVRNGQTVSLTGDNGFQITQAQVAGDIGNNMIQAGTIVGVEAGMMLIGPGDDVVKAARGAARAKRGIFGRIRSFSEEPHHK